MDTGIYRRGAIPLNDRQLQQAVRGGRVRQIRRGWYATPQASVDLVAAIRAHGVLTCISALRWHGIWVPPGTPAVHIRTHHALPVPAGVRICAGGSRALGVVDDPLSALRCSSRCLDDEGFVVVCDSLLRHGAALSDLRDAAGRRISLVELCDRADSGTESMVRLRLRARRITVRTQVYIAGIGTVDLLVGERLIIECDSREFHDLDPRSRDNDRKRDRAAVLLGYIVIRVSYQQVMNNWDDVEQEILAVVRADRHRRSPRPAV